MVIEKHKENFDQYFKIFPWDLLPIDTVDFYMGFGHCKWPQFVATEAKTLFTS